MKGSKGKVATTKGTKTNQTPNTGNRNPTTATKNSKDQFLKKLQLCMKTYDYKDETKDVRGKTERLNAINEL